jgi:hypothetical protein
MHCLSRPAERPLLGHALRPRVAQPVAHRGIIRPGWHQPPAQPVEPPHTCEALPHMVTFLANTDSPWRGTEIVLDCPRRNLTPDPAQQPGRRPTGAPMGRFINLLNYATKEFKFTQRKTLPEAEFVVTPADFQILKTGACAALTCAWIREKLSKPFDKKFEGKFQGPQIHTYRGQNYRTIGSIHKAQIASSNPDLLNAKSWLFDEFGLVLSKDDHADNYSKREYFNRFSKQNYSFAKLMCLYLRDILNNNPGSGAYIGVRVREKGQETIGHAFGLYLSRKFQLHFFDANCGVYQIHSGKIQEFFDTLSQCYSDTGHPIIEPFMDELGKSGIYLFGKAK